MIRHAALVVLLAVGASASVRAELKYTMHVELKKVESATPPANPMLAMMGDMLGQQLLPDGPADVIYIIGEKGTRAEFSKAAMGQPEGTIVLALPDGTMTVLNTKEQTYWKATLEAATGAVQAAGFKPTTTAKRTGEFATVAGVRCERVAVDMKLDLPIPEAMRASLPPGFPTSLAMDGETCVTTEQFQKYAELAAKNKAVDILSAMGLDKLMQSGIVLRQTIRLSGIEMESVVTAIGEEDVAPALFSIPADYKEVPSPLPIK
jgi:hypothetical protein